MDIYEARQVELFKRLPDTVETAVLTPGPSLLYLTGYDFNRTAWGQDSPFLYILTHDLESVVVLPGLETERAGDRLDAEFYQYGEDWDSLHQAVERVTADYDLDAPIAVEYSTMRLQEYALLEAVSDLSEAVDLSDEVTALRVQKDDCELEIYRKAAEITDEILGETLQEVTPGMQEQTIERMLHTRTVQSKADAYGSGVVTSGPRTAINYTDTTDRRIGEDDLVLVDMGIVYEGYYTDVTRTICVGEPNDEFAVIHRIVRDAARTVRQELRAGMTAHKVDELARQVIADAGYEDEFVHGLGHGIGLDSHEAPMLEPGNDRLLEEGNVFTVEPGIYIEGGGVRIEDNVALTADGPEVLTSLDRSIDYGQ